MLKLGILLFASVLLTCTIVSAEAEAARRRNAATEADFDDDCKCHVPLHLRPVCGSDGQTYPNKESLNCQNECEGTHVRIGHQGPCKGDQFVNGKIARRG